MAAVDIHTILSNAGIYPVRETNKEVYAHCPQHTKRTGKPDAHPSWSINKTTYEHHCFSCGYGGSSLRSLLLDTTGAAPEDLDKIVASEAFRRKMEAARDRPEEVLDPVMPVFTEYVLYNVMIEVPDRMISFRHLQRAAVTAMEVRWEREGHRWVMPLRSVLDGSLLGAQFRQKGTTLTLPDGIEKSLTLFGYHQCEEYGYVAIVESPLDAVRLFGLGIPAVSSLGAWCSPEQVKLLARTWPRVYVALDNDKVGNQASDRLIPALQRSGCAAVRWNYDGLRDEDGRKAKDPGDVVSDDMLLASWNRTARMGL